MTKIIQQLSPGVVKKLRSGVAFTNLAHCVEELVLNSIDAGANCIAVNLNLPLYQIQVIDNGCGISVEQMKMIGTRYATSKCHTLEDLQNLKSGGFRGEALASLKEVSSVLMIESRTAPSSETYCKLFTQGKALDPKKSLNSRPSRGTTVSVYDFMYNMPVRKQSISDALDLEECRKLLQSIALMYPNISFTLKNEATGEMCLQLKKCSSLYHSFIQIFGKSKVNNLKNIDYQMEGYELSGCISTNCYISKDLQFLYVNKRHVLRTKLHKLVNSILNKALSSKQKSNAISNSLASDSSTPAKNQSHCIFAINISCPYDKYDIIFEPRKTMIEFSEWDSILRVVEDALIDFLKRENLYSVNDETKLSILNSDSGETVGLLNSDVQNCQQGLFSHVVRRLKFSEFNDSDKNWENLRQGLEEDDVCKASIYNATREEMTSKFDDENISTSKESSLVHCGKNMESFYQESVIYPKKDKSNISLLDNCVSGIEKNHSKGTKNDFASTTQETEFDIPCRSVFPSENPVMLRVPAKSALSDLQTSSSNSNLLKIKEKIQCFVRKENTYPLSGYKFQRKCEKVSLRLNDMSKELSSENKSVQISPLLQINEEKYEGKLKEFSQMSMINKSSWCPSVSNNCHNATKDLKKNDTEEKSVIKETRDKSFQCPSISVDKQARVVSRFAFKEESTILPLKRMKKSKRLRRKSANKPYSNDIATKDNLLDNGGISNAKKLKSSHITQNTTISLNNTTEDNKNSDMDIVDFRISSEVRANSGEYINNFYAIHDIDDLESSAVSLKMFKNSDQSKITDLNKLKSSFNLQTFKKAKNLTLCADNIPVFTGLEDSHCLQKEKLLHQCGEDVDNYISENQVKNFQKSSCSEISDEIVNSTEDIEEKGHYITDTNLNLKFKKDIGVFVAESMHMEFETSNENSLAENVLKVYSNEVSPNLTDIVCDMMNDLDSNDNKGNNLSNFSNEIDLKGNVITEDIQKESCLNFENEVINNSFVAGVTLDKSHSDSSSVTSSVLEVKSVCDINFESDPFTEKLLSASENIVSLKGNNSQENNSSKNIPNCLSQELFDEQSVSELPNIDTEASTDKELIFEVSKTVLNMNNEVNLQACSTRHESDNLEKIDKNAIDVEPEAYSHWKLHSQPECKRKIYVDTITGNSMYSVPGINKTGSNINVGSNNDSIENMLNGWDNPVFDIPYEVTSVADNKISQKISQMCTFINSYRFSKDTLNSLQVIGQVDCKFIACILKDFNANCRDQRLLALFDQHAVHERIRLEKLTEDLYEIDENGGRSVKTSTISLPLEISFNDEEIRLLNVYNEKLHKIGIHINVDSESHAYRVLSVPLCLVHKETGELRRSVSDTITVLQNSVAEWLSSVVKTRSIPQVLPKTLLSVLNYQACRGAVKFGDPLSLEQCCDLMKSLSICKLPFQCAHGRPSIAPILDLKKVEALYKKRPPPQLRTLLLQFEE